MKIENWQNKCDGFLPVGWKFDVSKRGLYVDWEREKIFLPNDFASGDENILSIMHEIGHAFLDIHRTEESLEHECWLRDKASFGFECLSDEERADYVRIVIGEEIKAWDFVMDKIEILKVSGLLSISVDKSVVLELAKRKLESYKKILEP